MKYVIAGQATSESLGRFAASMADALEREGWDRGDDVADADLVLNLVDAGRPEAVPPPVAGHVRRRALRAARGARRRAARRTIRCSSARSRTSCSATSRSRASGSRRWSAATTASRRPTAGALADGVVERLLPLATSQLVIDNEFRTDLEPELWDGDELTEEISDGRRAAGRPRPAAGAVPDRGAARRARPSPRQAPLRHRRALVRQPLGAQGRDALLDERERRRQVAAREPGRDILLVSGYDRENARMILSVPPGVEPRRVSVDAIEHWMIYQRASRRRRDPARPRVDGGDRRDRHQLPVRHRGARRARRRAARARARPRARRDRPAQPRHHRHRREPARRSSTGSSRGCSARCR